MKNIAKRIVQTIAIAIVSPLLLTYWLACTFVGKERAFPGCSQLLSLVPGFVGQYLRVAFYRLVFPEFGQGICLSFGTVFSHPTARIGDHAYVGLYCVLGDVTIEADVLISSNVSIINGGRQHSIDRLDLPIREQPGEFPRVTIGCDSWIGERAVIMADVGRHCVIGAGAVVAKPIPDYAIAFGVPARVVGSRKELAKRDVDATPLPK